MQQTSEKFDSFCLAFFGSLQILRLRHTDNNCNKQNGYAKLSRNGGVHCTRVHCKNKLINFLQEYNKYICKQLIL